MVSGRNTKGVSQASSIWGGRFEAGPSQIMEEINASIDFDRRLYRQDIAASKAHCEMLVRQGIIAPEDGDAILGGLDKVLSEIENGDFEFKTALEDIHMNVEGRLAELIGEAAGRLHTARSRNDQVATDFKLWVRDAIDQLDGGLKSFQSALITAAEAHTATIMPGYTHLQTAQPVTAGHHLLAYVEMAGRDRGRFGDCRARLNENPLGSGALAGTSFPIDRQATSEALGFDRPAANSLDAVSDRDFAIEFLAAAAITATHLSRLAEEMVIWASEPFRFITLSDAFSTGSSMLPQKRNPDAAELVRAKTGRIFGTLMGLLTVMKGLPLAYSKDMQEDKQPVFETADALNLCLAAMTGMIADLRVDEDRMRAAAAAGGSNAVDVADWLVRNLDMPFREAHRVTGNLVKLAENKSCPLEDLELADFHSIEPGITDDIYSVLGLEESVAGRVSYGGTAPANVASACAEARRRFLDGGG